MKKLHKKRKSCDQQIDDLQYILQNKKIGMRRLIIQLQSKKVNKCRFCF